MKNCTNFPKRGYTLDSADKRAIKKAKKEEHTKRRLRNRVDINKLYSDFKSKRVSIIKSDIHIL